MHLRIASRSSTNSKGFSQQRKDSALNPSSYFHLLLCGVLVCRRFRRRWSFFQGCLICLTLALGRALAAYVRNREIKQLKDTMKNGNSFSFLYHDINELERSYQVNLPRVTVVMPLKGFGEHNLHNWRSQITSLYGGPLEFLFVVESTEDPAYHAMISEFEDDVDEFKSMLKMLVLVVSLTSGYTLFHWSHNTC